MPYEPAGKLLGSPLLPFELELIRILGCTEQEYRNHVEEVKRKGGVRPAEYALIPDVQNGPVVPALISLAVGLAVSAVSALLAPKPKAPDQQDRSTGKAIRLASRRGSERFGATSGFDSFSDLANYAEPIAVLFARRQDNIGGVLTAEQLVWSRAYSYGNEQGIKLMYVIGEQGLGNGIAPPDLEGIFLGTTPLDSIYGNKFAFYWNRNTNVNGRILAKNFAYGTRATPDAGDPQANDDIFLCPTGIAANDEAFSQSLTPGSNSTFGCYAGISNGCGYRVNWELVPMPDIKDEDGDDRAERLNASARKRVKISGNFKKDNNDGDVDSLVRKGQQGVGREYSTLMGLRTLNGQSIAPGGPQGHKVLATINVNDVVTFDINGKVLSEDLYWDGDNKNDVNVDDINNTTINMREAADDTLQIGQIVMIGNAVFVVTARAIDKWGANVVGPFEERIPQSITMKCIDNWAADPARKQIGFISNDALTRRVRTDDQGNATYTYASNLFEGLTIGPGFFPIMLVDFGVVRNTRPCETTEMGIRSQVWNRANGLCNFGSLPTAEGMRRSDSRGDSLTSGTMNLYFNRASVFTVFLRPAGVDPSTGKQYDWAPINEQFVVRGNRPVDQYNYLRFIHPEIREYEYRFIPKNGADLTQFVPDEAEFWLLDSSGAAFAGQGIQLSQPYSTPYGTFVVQTAGRRVSKGSIEFAPEMATGVKSNTEVQPIIQAPSDVIIASYVPDIEGGQTKATSVVQEGDGWSSVPEGSVYRQAAFFWELWGQSSFEGKTGNRTIRFDGLRPEKPGGPNRWLELNFKGVVDRYFPPNEPNFPGFRAWSLTSITVVNSSAGMNTGDTFNCRVPCTPGNPRNPAGYSQVGVEVRVNQTTGLTSLGGRQNAYSWELLGDPSSKNVGQRYSTTRTLEGGGGKETQVLYSAQVINATQELRDTFGVSKAYDFESVAAIPNTTFGNWSTQESVQNVVDITPGNPFASASNLTFVGIIYQIVGIRQEKEILGFSGDRLFEENAGITDISNYTERTTSNSDGPEHTITYVSETIKPRNFAYNYDKLTTCGLAIRSGRNFRSVEQLRTWLGTGIEVKRFLPAESGTIGPSNMLPDLIYYLLTDKTAGVGESVRKELIDESSFTEACTFLKTNKLYFNGAISEPQNLRDYITTIAPFFLLDFAIINGRFSFTPAVPVTPAGVISEAKVPISALFTEGNIIQDTFAVEFLEADQRRDFIALMRWRDEQVNKLPEERTVSVRWNEANSDTYPIESFDMTDYCCSEEHAVIAAKYLLSLRRRVTHTVTFKTVPEGLNLEPGQYIKVVTQASPYQAANNGIIEDDGTLIMSQAIEDGVYPIWYYSYEATDTLEGQMTVVSGKVTETALWGTIVTLRYPGISTQIYQVQQLTLEEDGLVEIVALEHPTNEAGTSQIGLDLKPINNSLFTKDF